MSNVEPQINTHFTSCVFTGIIMSKTYGVAKQAKAVSVRVLDENGYGSSTYDKKLSHYSIKIIILYSFRKIIEGIKYVSEKADIPNAIIK